MELTLLDYEMARRSQRSRRIQRIVVLPPQQPVVGTYMGNALGVRASLVAIDRLSLEDKVATGMVGILLHLLPTNAGYCAAPETWVKLPGKKGRIDMAYQYSPDGDMILYPLCLEYKAPKYAEKPRAWAAAKTQLTNYTYEEYPFGT